MAMAVEDQVPHDLGFSWENQSWGGLSNYVDISNGEPKEKLEVVMKESNEGGGGESVVKNNKRSRASRKRGKRVLMKNDGEAEAEEDEDDDEDDDEGSNKDHELHIWTERERRKKMRNMFATLHALLPQLPSKADKTSIVDEAVRYIKTLQEDVENLEKKKREKTEQDMSPTGCESSVINSHWNPIVDSPNQSSSSNLPLSSPSDQHHPVAFKTFASTNLVLTVFGNEAQFSICATRKQGLLTTIAFVLEKHRLDVITANIFCNGNANRYMILAHANKDLPQFQDEDSVEQTFRRAGGEIMMWLS